MSHTHERNKGKVIAKYSTSCRFEICQMWADEIKEMSGRVVYIVVAWGGGERGTVSSYGAKF